MSVDLSIIVKNDFDTTYDPEACREYVMGTIDELKRYFLSEDIIEDLLLEEDDFSFYLKPLDHVRVHLHKGCWEFETCYSYWKYFLKDENNDNFFRRFAFDCARALGKDEAWITNEYGGWASALSSISDGFEDWVKYKSDTGERYYRILEFNPDDFPNVNDWNEEASCKYHDSFAEPKKRLEQLSKKFPEFEILTISGHVNVILAKKEGKLYAIDIDRGKLLLDYPIDGVNDNFNSMAIEIYKDGNSALFSRSGEQLTPFSQHDFEWNWGKRDFSIVVRDNLTGQHWTFPEGL